eukprot:2974639-Pleurochrysis_carterae.AAC.3
MRVEAQAKGANKASKQAGQQGRQTKQAEQHKTKTIAEANSKHFVAAKRCSSASFRPECYVRSGAWGCACCAPRESKTARQSAVCCESK